MIKQELLPPKITITGKKLEGAEREARRQEILQKRGENKCIIQR